MTRDLVLTANEMARHIDHTLLKPEATREAFDRLCNEAIQHGFKTVCVNSNRVADVARKLRGTGVGVCAAIAFPFGAMHRDAKAFEARTAVDEGANELDMVMSIGGLKSGDLVAVEDDIAAVRRAAPNPTLLKVIIETCLLTDEEKVAACRLSVTAGADFVKTSTGFSTGGATLEDVGLMRRVVVPAVGVKASGGIKDYSTAARMIAAGASRIGAGAGVVIVSGAPSRIGR